MKRLPNGELAWVEERKIRLYLLDLEHEQGAPKAKFFLKRGFTIERWEEMSKALVTQATTNPVAKTVKTEFGTRHTVDCNCPTPDALDPCIRTVWEIGEDDMRLGSLRRIRSTDCEAAMTDDESDDEIEEKVNEVLKDHELEETLPIDPLYIAGEEGIDVLPGDYDGCFDGRIEFHRENGVGHFYLMYAQEELPFRPQGRVRFSIAHELGHFYLPAHREYLRSGQFHNSESDFVSSKIWEREADKFAARLLMPKELFRDKVRERDGFLTLADLSKLASDVFHTSLTSTVLRYVKMDFEPCCMVMAERGTIKWSARSYDMKRQALGWTDWGSKLPPNSVTAKAIISKLSGSQPTTGGTVDSSVWFDRRNSCRILEEVLLLTSSGRTLTFMTPEHNSNRYD